MLKKSKESEVRTSVVLEKSNFGSLKKKKKKLRRMDKNNNLESEQEKKNGEVHNI